MKRIDIPTIFMAVAGWIFVTIFGLWLVAALLFCLENTCV